jgi:hypothetical protein
MTHPLALLAKPLLDMGSTIIDRVFPDKVKQAAERAQAELALTQMVQDGRLKEMATSMSAIIAEAQSPDPWTSRARPSFLYVMYVMILMAIPMGVLSAFKPDLAVAIAAGMKAWLAAIPSELYTLFGVGYLGYAGARMFEKRVGVTK